jgi:hypothetical protein
MIAMEEGVPAGKEESMPNVMAIEATPLEPMTVNEQHALMERLGRERTPHPGDATGAGGSGGVCRSL